MKRTLLAFILIGAFLIATLIPGTASAERWGITAINVSPQIASDNNRYVSFQRRNGMPVVLDTWRGKYKVLRGAWHCHPRDIGGGRVLLICPHSRPTKKNSGFHARTGSVHGGKTIPLAGSRKINDAFEIGRFWVPVQIGRVSTDGRIKFRYLNWRTGTMKRYRPTYWWAYGSVDLDHPRLAPADIQTFRPKVQEGPLPSYAVVSTCRGKDVVVTDWRNELRLWWSRTDSVLLGKGHLFYDDCQWHQSIRIGDNWVTWSRGRALHAYNFRTGQRFNRRYRLASHVTPIRDGVVIARRLERYGKFYKAYRIRVIRL